MQPCSKWVRTRAARTMSPILPGLVVMCWKARHRPVSRATRVRPGSVEIAGGRCRCGIDIEFTPACGLLHRNMDPDARGLIARGRPRRAAAGGDPVETGQGVGTGGGDVMHRARFHVGGPQREPVRAEDRLDVAAVAMRPAVALPEYHRSMISPFTLMAGSRHRSAPMTVPSGITCGKPSSLSRSSASRSSGASAASTSMTSSR